MRLKEPGLWATALLLAACATGGQPGVEAPAPGTPSSGGAPARGVTSWPIRTRLHIDAWLHGFAMVQDDTTQVPYFARGYRERMISLKNRANVVTQLELNRERLRARFDVSRTLTSAQFLALYFASWEDLTQAIEIFLESDGDPRRGGNPTAQAIIATFAQLFPTAGDRDWLRLFTVSLRDEMDKFYRGYWTQQQRERQQVVSRLDTLWERSYYPRLARYLNNTRLQTGDWILSLPLDGEGRTVTAPTITTGRQSNTIVTSFPEAPGDAIEALYVFAHEASSAVTLPAVNDNTTPNEQRSGVSDRYGSAAAVVGGAMLLKRVAPDLVDGYARYYYRVARISYPGGDPLAALARVYPLPDGIRDAIARQLDIVLGGI